MKKIWLLMMISAFLFACNNQNTDNQNRPNGNESEREAGRDNKKDSKNEDDDDRNRGSVEDEQDRDRKVNSNWTKNDETAFLRDCEMESRDEVINGKLKEFCSCMLTEAKKNYSNYEELENSNSEADMNIFGDCMRTYGDFNN